MIELQCVFNTISVIIIYDFEIGSDVCPRDLRIVLLVFNCLKENCFFLLVTFNDSYDLVTYSEPGLTCEILR